MQKSGEGSTMTDVNIQEQIKPIRNNQKWQLSTTECEQTSEICPQVDKDAAYILITAAVCHAVYTICFTASLCSVCKCLPTAKDDEQWLSWENSWTMIYGFTNIHLYKIFTALAESGPEAHRHTFVLFSLCKGDLTLWNCDEVGRFFFFFILKYVFFFYVNVMNTNLRDNPPC